MLRLLGWLKKISLIGLVAAVLTPFVFRPFLSLGVCQRQIVLEKASIQSCPTRHHVGGLMNQLNSQTREIDSKIQKPSEYLSKSGQGNQPLWISVGLEAGLVSRAPNSKPARCLLFLRI
jgi:hypothetical protein